MKYAMTLSPKNQKWEIGDFNKKEKDEIDWKYETK